MGLLDRVPVDMVVLDLATSGLDAFALTRKLRSGSQIGIILVAPIGDFRQKLVALQLGADEFLFQPLEWPELIARVNNLTRRIHACMPQDPCRSKLFDGWTLHLDKRRLVNSRGTDIRLTGAEFELLAVFASNPGRILSRDFLLEATTRRKPDPMDRTIDTLVRRLRRILEADPRNPRLLTTVHGQGYVFTGEVV